MRPRVSCSSTSASCACASATRAMLVAAADAVGARHRRGIGVLVLRELAAPALALEPQVLPRAGRPAARRPCTRSPGRTWAGLDEAVGRRRQHALLGAFDAGAPADLEVAAAPARGTAAAARPPPISRAWCAALGWRSAVTPAREVARAARRCQRCVPCCIQRSAGAASSVSRLEARQLGGGERRAVVRARGTAPHPTRRRLPSGIVGHRAADQALQRLLLDADRVERIARPPPPLGRRDDEPLLDRFIGGAEQALRQVGQVIGQVEAAAREQPGCGRVRAARS